MSRESKLARREELIMTIKWWIDERLDHFD